MALSGSTKFFAVVILLLVAFLGGFVPTYFENRQLKQNCAADRERVQLLQLQAQLGMLLVEAERGNFGNARQRSSTFFNGLRDYLNAAPEGAGQGPLLAILNQRDEVVAALTELNAEAAVTLRDLYVQLQEIAGGR